jgi:uncharacterized protein (TIGR02145 family)
MKYHVFQIFSLILLLSSCKHELELQDIPNDKVTPTPFIPCPDSIVDIDGNVYEVIDVDGTCWTTSNLTVSRFSNGDSIPTETLGENWIQLTTSAQCFYENDSANLNIYGRLYNGYAASDSRGVCPTGWAVPHDSDWVNMANYLGGESIAGDKLKTLDLWYGPGTPATDEIGFSAKPGGDRIIQGNGSFGSLTSMGNWWTLTEEGSEVLKNRYITYANSFVLAANNSKKLGFSIRCIRK